MRRAGPGVKLTREDFLLLPLLILATVVTLMLAPACRTGDDTRAERLALRARMTPAVGAEMSWTFTVRRSGPYNFGLEFSSPIEDAAVADVVQRAAAGAGMAKTIPAEFDFSWRIVNETKEVARGSGEEGVRGIIDSSDPVAGGGPMKSRALVFATFPAETGVPYTLRVTPRSGFIPLFRANPAFIIERRPAS
jgi:hypothetical protein